MSKKAVKEISLIVAFVLCVLSLSSCSNSLKVGTGDGHGTMSKNSLSSSISEEPSANFSNFPSTVPGSSGDASGQNTPNVSPSPVLPTSPQPTPSDPTPWILKETADAGVEYQNSLIFLGDSTTAHLVDREALTGGKDTKQVWMGSEGKTITFAYLETVKILYPETGEAMYIWDAARLAKPQYMVITLGVTGGVSLNMNEDGFKKLYRFLLDKIFEASPTTEIIVQSIYPVNKINTYETKNITNDNIKKYNRYIVDLAKEYHQAGKKVFYADTFSALVDREGYLPAEFGVGDGLHLSKQGYDAILSYLRTHALTLQKN